MFRFATKQGYRHRIKNTRMSRLAAEILWYYRKWLWRMKERGLKRDSCCLVDVLMDNYSDLHPLTLRGLCRYFIQRWPETFDGCREYADRLYGKPVKAHPSDRFFAELAADREH